MTDSSSRALGYDTARCAGRYDLQPDGKWCPERDTCQRYLAFIKWDKAAGVPDYSRIAVKMGQPGCKDKIDLENKYENE